MQLFKLFFSLLAVFVGLFLVLVSALRLSWQSVRAASEGSIPAQEIVQPDMEESDTESMVPEKILDQENKDLDYYLPYPGILPDHPLYWLKMVRDRIMLWTTRDPLQQFQRLLHYSDKRIGAAKALIEGGQPELGVTTATKAEKYLERAVNQYKKLDALGKINPETEEQLERAVEKHQELIEGFLLELPDQAKAGLGRVLETTRMSWKAVQDKKN
ncbi:MAG: hypothetical protein ACD_57C00104G0001 [uncultured bacterium]|nr:MAG: hypothetical protein ACD_57C00104G0001 [uncultured bacterium]